MNKRFVSLLMLVLVADDFVRGGRLLCQPFVQPRKNGPNVLIYIAQPLKQLDGEGSGQRAVFKFLEKIGGRQVRKAVCAQQAVRERVGFFPRGAAAHDALGEPAKIFHEHDAQRNRHGPQLADREGLNTLIGLYEAPEHFRIEAAVCMSDEGPGDAENARKPLEVSGRKFRQLSIKARREVLADFAKLLIDDVEIVDQPFRGWGDDMFLLNRLSECPVGFEQDPAVFQNARGKRTPASELGFDGLRSREALGMLLEAFHAEKFAADWLLFVRQNACYWTCTAHRRVEAKKIPFRPLMYGKLSYRLEAQSRLVFEQTSYWQTCLQTEQSDRRGCWLATVLNPHAASCGEGGEKDW